MKIVNEILFWKFYLTIENLIFKIIKLKTKLNEKFRRTMSIVENLRLINDNLKNILENFWKYLLMIILKQSWENY